MAYLGFGKHWDTQKLNLPKDLLEVTVLTTEQILSGEHDITFAAFFSDENLWQFFSNQNPNHFEDKLCVVKMIEVIDIDASVMQIGEIPEGFVALRETKNAPWHFKSLL